jgi:hypothetical protein
LNDSERDFGDTLQAEGEIATRRLDDLNIQERQSLQQFKHGCLISNGIVFDQSDAIDVIGFQLFGNKTPIQYQSLCTGLLNQVNQLSQRFHLDAAELGLAAEAVRDLVEGCPMDSRRQISVGVEGNKHFHPLYWLL